MHRNGIKGSSKCRLEKIIHAEKRDKEIKKIQAQEKITSEHRKSQKQENAGIGKEETQKQNERRNRDKGK